MDGLVPVFIETADVMSKPFALIYQKTSEFSIIPKNWKKANVTEVQGTILAIIDLRVSLHIFVSG